QLLSCCSVEAKISMPRAVAVTPRNSQVQSLPCRLLGCMRHGPVDLDRHRQREFAGRAAIAPLALLALQRVPVQLPHDVGSGTLTVVALGRLDPLPERLQRSSSLVPVDSVGVQLLTSVLQH